MAIILSQLGDRGTMYVIRPTEAPAILGSDASADVRVDDRLVSPLHCMIDRVDERWVLVDLTTRGGTYLNGHRVAQAGLDPGDRIMVGGTAFRVHYDRPSRPAGRVPPDFTAHSA